MIEGHIKSRATVGLADLQNVIPCSLQPRDGVEVAFESADAFGYNLIPIHNPTAIQVLHHANVDIALLLAQPTNTNIKAGGAVKREGEVVGGVDVADCAALKRGLLEFSQLF